MRRQQVVVFALMLLALPQLLWAKADTSSDQGWVNTVLDNIATWGVEYSSGMLMVFAIGLVLVGLRRKQMRNSNSSAHSAQTPH
jgi:hypothetical protein